jgi:cell division protein FtsW
MFRISANAERLARAFSCYLVSGVALLFGVQTMINMGVNLGLLPPKGLTLPLMSYGGSSMIVMCVSVAIVLRVEWENCYIDPRRLRKTAGFSPDSGSRTVSVSQTTGSANE